MPAPAQSTATLRAAAVRAAVAAIGVTLVAACGSTTPAIATPSASPSASAPPSASGSPSAAPTQAGLLLEVRSEGGFINPSASIGALPTVVVDTAGRIYTPHLPTNGTGPLVGQADVRDTGPAGAAAIEDAARAAGLADGSASGGGVVADTGTTVFTLDAGGTEVVSRVVAGGPGGGPGRPGASDGGSAAPGSAALALLAALTDPSHGWGGVTPTPVMFRPTAYRLWVAPDPSAAGAQVPPWPLAVAPTSFGAPAAAGLGVDGLRSGIVSGAEATTLAAKLEAVPAGTDLWSGAGAWRVWIAPVLPASAGG